MRRFIFLLGPAWVLCVIFLGLRSAEAQKLRVAWTAVSALNAPYWVMKDGGFFKQEGLDVDLVYIPSSTVVASAMLAGEAAISTANSQVVVDSGLQGSDLVIIGGVVNVAAFYIMGRARS
jgi:NitT/TauT family transport system substrate-binding protein